MPANLSGTGWMIGVGRQTITPPLGCQMAGFDARKGVANDVHDHLNARALVFDDGQTKAAFVSVEVIALSADFAINVRKQIESLTGIKAQHIFLSATHTHCGPVTINHFFNQGQPLDDTYLRTLAEGIVSAVAQAHANRRPRKLKTGLAECNGIAINRRTDNGLPVDPCAGILLIEEPDGNPIGIAVIYACHTTVLGPDTLSITQDFPFYTLAKLKTSLSNEVETLFFNGAEGDLSIGHKSDLSAVGIVDSYRTFETAQRLGERLADAVIDNLSQLTEEPPAISVINKNVALPLKQYAPLPEMTEATQEALRKVDPQLEVRETLAPRQRYLFARIEEYYAKLYEASETNVPKTLQVEFAAISLGNTVLLTLPGEVFVRIALEIRKHSPYPRTLFLGLTNDYIGYVPDEQATASAGYEVIASRVPATAGIILQQQAASMLTEMYSQHKATEGSPA